MSLALILIRNILLHGVKKGKESMKIKREAKEKESTPLLV